MFEPNKKACSAALRNMGLSRDGYAAVLVVSALLAGCANAPAPAPVAEPAPPAVVHTVERFHAELGDGFSLDYQVEKKASKVNSKSCFAFITGKLNNQSGKTLSRKSVLDVAVFGQGTQLYRDLSSPLTDIAPGGRADIEMVVSPVFANGCPPFDKVNTVLRSVFQ
jgi:hypothetical protein